MQGSQLDTLPHAEIPIPPDADGRGYGSDATRHGDHGSLDWFDDGTRGYYGNGVIHYGVR